MRSHVILALVAATNAAFAQRSDTIVRNVGAPRYPGVATLVPEVTIGGPNATADEYLFQSIRIVLAASDGSVWVGDGRFPMGQQTLRQFDATGKFVRNIGGRGNGPGEWQIPGKLTQMRDNRVLLRDEVVGKPLTFYKPNGDYDTTWAFQTSTLENVDADTSHVVWIRMRPGVGMPRPGEGAASVMVRFTASGRIIDTVPEPPVIQPTRATLSVTSANGRSTMGVMVPFQPGAFRAWSPSGYYATGVSNRYAIDLLIPKARQGAAPLWRPGDPVTSIRRNVPAVMVTDAERADQRTHMEAQADAMQGTRNGAIPDVPREKQPVKWFTFDVEGRLWVQVSQPSERFEPPPQDVRPGTPARPVLKWREPMAFDVFERDGAYVGRVAVPTDVRIMVGVWMPLQARANQIWGVAVDSDGVQSVVRYRITWR